MTDMLLSQVTVEHIKDFFVNHAINYNLGQIANAWLVHADLQGAGCAPCLALAQLHSRAVDFSKTGDTLYGGKIQTQSVRSCVGPYCVCCT